MNSSATQLAYYRLTMVLQSLLAIYKLSQAQIDGFLASYDLFDKEKIDEHDETKVVNYYSVLNHLCTIGEVEKMYIPAVIDVTKGIRENQLLFENKMSKDLNIKPGQKILDIGCGRGRVAAHIASTTKANVIGLNIDEVQLGNVPKVYLHFSHH
jgi:sterol 24-C-methyltransferase